MFSENLPFEWQQVDQRLASLMLGKLSEEIRLLSYEDDQNIRFQNMGNENSMTVPSERLKMYRLRSNEWAARKYEIYCEVWRLQQKPLSPGFLRAICKFGIRVLISARTSSVISEFAMEQRRTHSYDPNWLKPVTEAFRRDMERLFTKWEQAAEIDAKGLEYMQRATQDASAALLAAREIVEARAKTRTFAAMIESVDARIEMAERALTWMRAKETPPYRKISVEQSLEKLRASKKEFESRKHKWELTLSAAMNRSTSFARQEPVQQSLIDTSSISSKSEDLKSAEIANSGRAKKKRAGERGSKLPAKINDLSKYLDQAKLTDRQRECWSLKLEYCLTVTAIANRLGISRKTVDGHIIAAEHRINSARVKNSPKALRSHSKRDE